MSRIDISLRGDENDNGTDNWTVVGCENYTCKNRGEDSGPLKWM